MFNKLIRTNIFSYLHGHRVNKYKPAIIRFFSIILVCSLIILFLGLYLFFFSSVAYAMEGGDEIFPQKIDKIQDMIEYHKDQVHESTEMFRESIYSQDANQMKGAKEALKESQTNLNSEQRMLRILNQRLESGESTLPTTK